VVLSLLALFYPRQGVRFLDPELLYSLEDGTILVNGQSGFYPPEWVEFLKISKTFPSRESIQAIRDRGIELLVVDKKELKETIPLPVVFEDTTCTVYNIRS
jgi:hypothetical protein